MKQFGGNTALAIQVYIPHNKMTTYIYLSLSNFVVKQKLSLACAILKYLSAIQVTLTEKQNM